MAKKKKVRRFYDYSLLFCVIFLMAFGLVMIYSASSYTAQLTQKGDSTYFLKRQFVIAVGGLLVAIIISKMDYRWFQKLSMLGYLLSYVLMVAVTFVGKEINGKKRWLGVGMFSFQPTEFAKVALIVFLAAYVVKHVNKLNTWKGMIQMMILAFPIAAIVGLNNLSSGVIILGIAVVMLFVACKRYAIFLCSGVGAFALIFTAQFWEPFLEKMNILHAYQMKRIHVWLDPTQYAQEGGYQVLQGLYAIGSGGLFGKGLGESIQKLGFVPEAQNDMIFSIICEELGLFGAVSVILIFMFMIYRCMVIANNAPDLFGAMLVVGVMAHIAIQVILNIAVVTNTIPNTGITLPFISYGGTSVLFLMVEMGMVLSVSNRIRLEQA